MNSELETKTQRLTRMLADENLDGVLLNSQHNFGWLTCGGSNGIDLSRENGAGFLLVTKDGKRYLIANNIEIARLTNEELGGADFEPIEITWQAEKDPHAVLDAAASVAGGKDFGCDVGFPETRWIEPSIAGCRFELTPEEIGRFTDIGRDTGLALENVVPRLAPGLTEKEIARITRAELALFDIYSIVTLVAADERIASYRHPVPTDNVFRRTLMIVVCARRQGMIASLTRIVCSGEVPGELQQRTEACAAVNAALYAATAAGTTGAELYAAAAKAYEDQGFAEEINKHHQGGAAGYRTRDWVAHPDSHDIVRANQAFAWNPSITGTKTEETAILTDSGLHVITASKSFPKIRTVIDGREFLSPGILSLSKGVAT